MEKTTFMDLLVLNTHEKDWKVGKEIRLQTAVVSKRWGGAGQVWWHAKGVWRKEDFDKEW